MFKRRQKTETAPPAAPTPTAPLDREVYLRELRATLDQILNVTPGEGGSLSWRNEIARMTSDMMQEAEKVDFESLTAEEQQNLVLMLTQRISTLKTTVVLDAKDWDWEDIHDYLEYALPNQTHWLLALTDTQDNRKRAQAVSVAEDQTWQQVSAGTGAQARVVFPAFTSGNETLQAAYDHLRDTWSQASLRELGVEDAYTITALATTYLPDSIRIYQRLTHRSTLALEQGTQLLLGQFALLQQQLDAILSKETANTLSEMQAQTRFLASKVPAPDNI